MFHQFEHAPCRRVFQRFACGASAAVDRSILRLRMAKPQARGRQHDLAAARQRDGWLYPRVALAELGTETLDPLEQAQVACPPGFERSASADTERQPARRRQASGRQ
ncbi:hypothetical protein [Nitratireductor mangrovi]|uniref:hypothetical protein n=1 Tax=Nitratireductor mangrovi TaxID=2599600 RepID=UPI001FEE8B5B|nr:hypothetical protein [Nitratireductor mangrovi]